MRKHKRFKKILLVMMLIGALLGVQVMEIIAYASEEGGGSVPTVQVSTLDELTGAIDAAQNGDVIGVTAEIFIPKSSTIGSDGKTVTIMRTADTGKITFDSNFGDEVTKVKNLIFDGNSISSFSFVTVYQKVDFSNCTFKNCISTENGGAVSIQNGTVNFTNCLFQNNTAPGGGHIFVGSGSNCKCILSECDLLNGKSQNNGGAIYIHNEGTCKIEKCTIKDNTATYDGGAVFNNGYFDSSESRIYSNTASNGNDIYSFYADTTVQIETDLTELQQIFGDGFVIKGWKIVDTYDGAIREMTLEYSIIPELDEVCSNFSQLYQAVNNAKDGDVIGIDTLISIQNEASVLGCEDKTVTIVKMNDYASFEIATKEPFTFKNLLLDGNKTTAYSGFVTVYSGVIFENVTIQNCKNVYDGSGGAVTLIGGKSTFNNSNFQNNEGVTGGHLYIMNDAESTFINCTFTGGSSAKGGAVYRAKSTAIDAWTTIKQSRIQGNTASESGGGIYSDGIVIVEDSKVFGNTAPLGEDMSDTPDGSVQVSDDLTTLQELYADENITVNGLIITLDDSTGMRYIKLDYEEKVEEPEQPTDPSVPDDGDDGEQKEPTEPDTGEDTTDPSQPDDSDQGVGETPSDPTTPDDSEDPSTPTDPGDSETPSDPSDPGEAPGDDSGSSGDNITTDTDNSSSDTNSTDNSDHSSIKEDNSVTNTNSGNTTNSSSDHSQRTEDNSSVTYNYYYPSDSGAKDQEQQQIVIHNYIQEENPNQSQEETKSDPTDNISIDAEDVDVSFEVKDGVYSISIKAQNPEPQVQQAAEEPASETSMVNWYEIIKIGLLGAIVFVVKKK